MNITHFVARVTGGLVCLVIAGFLAVVVSSQRPHFYPDDPLQREPESQDPSKAEGYAQPDIYEMFYGLFYTARVKPTGVRAKNINTIDEVPDSSWFTNRVGTVAVTGEEIARGPVVGLPPDPSQWVIVREKTSGAHPGFTARDAKGDTFFIEFDPTEAPEGATAAVVIATKIFWALGYNQVESYITTFDPRRASIDPSATLRRPSGDRTPYAQDDVDSILERVAQNADGTYRVIAGRLLPGRILGEFRYQGTRPDDPNDIVPHEHRRELRALRVFGAWTNLTDIKDVNTLDTLITENGRTRVKHYLQDVGSSFGMTNDRHEWDDSWEYFIQTDASIKRFWSFGFALSPWQTVDYERHSSIGKFEGDVFEPRSWRPHTPTRGYIEMRDDDAFWAARRVAAFTDDLIRAAVHTGQFSDPAAEKYLGDVLIKRRDKIKSVYLTALNPIVNPRLELNGRMTFENAAFSAGVASGAAVYRARWARFDNTTGVTQPLGETRSETTTIDAPPGLPAASGSYIAVEIAIDSAGHPAWQRPITTHFRRENGGWKLVGLERMPAGPPTSE